MHDIIIIGAGSAGLTAGIYSARNGHDTLILEKSSPGGQIISTLDIENYPGFDKISGFDFSMSIKKQAQNLGAVIKMSNVISVDLKNKIVKTKKEEFSAKAIIIANGCIPKNIGCENEENLVGKGVSYCATCDGNFFRNKDVAVVGGGNTALEDAIFLSNICKTVYLIHRRNSFRGDAKTVTSLKNKSNVKFILESTVESIIGTEQVEGISIKNIVTNNISSINLDGIFVAIGQTPETMLYNDQLNLDKYGYIISDESCKTAIDGVFVAGDVRTKPLRQLVTATADGAVAAVAASEYIGNL